MSGMQTLVDEAMDGGAMVIAFVVATLSGLVVGVVIGLALGRWLI